MSSAPRSRRRRARPATRSGVDVALVGAAEGGGHAGLDRPAGGVGHLDDPGDLAPGFRRRRAPRLRRLWVVAGRHHRLELVGAGGQRPLRPPPVGRQRGVGHPRPAGDGGQHLLGAGHGRDGLGPHERRHLDAAHAGGRQRVDQPHPVGHRHRRLVLQPVAGPDLPDVAPHRREFSHDGYGRTPSGPANLTLGRVAGVVVARRADEIVDIAARLFYERGYPSVSTRALAQAAGIQGGSLYHHFASKEEILYRIVQYGSGEFFAGLLPHLDAPDGGYAAAARPLRAGLHHRCPAPPLRHRRPVPGHGPPLPRPLRRAAGRPPPLPAGRAAVPGRRRGGRRVPRARRQGGRDRRPRPLEGRRRLDREPGPPRRGGRWPTPTPSSSSSSWEPRS